MPGVIRSQGGRQHTPVVLFLEIQEVAVGGFQAQYLYLLLFGGASR